MYTVAYSDHRKGLGIAWSKSGRHARYPCERGENSKFKSLNNDTRINNTGRWYTKIISKTSREERKVVFNVSCGTLQ